MSASALSCAWCVFRKELIDALRDRRTLLMVFVSSVLMGPVILAALTQLLASFEERAEKRQVYAAGMQHAPTLRSYIERQTHTVVEAPTDYEKQLKKSELADPVVVVPQDFEDKLGRGEAPQVEVVTSSANQRAQVGLGRITRLLRGFGREQAMLRLAVRGVSPSLLEPVLLQERDLASQQSRSAQLTGILPLFVLMAVVYGLIGAALDTTAGERERGSLEPLLMNPAPHGAIVVGKWAAVSCVGLLVATLSSLSFLPAQWVIQSDSLQALFQYGLRESLAFIGLLIPFSFLVAALVMAVAIRCKTYKEAQASATGVVLFVSLAPTLTVFNPGAEQPWHVWVPALSQNTMMTRVIKGEPLPLAQLAIPYVVTAVLCLVALSYVARTLRQAATR
jgi:sodium transport system permease protein